MSAPGFPAVRFRVITAMVVTVSIVVPDGVSAQSAVADSRAHAHTAGTTTAADPEVNRLLEATRKAAAEFHDRRNAIAAGYRRIGPDVPSMGAHWISPRLVVADSFDVRQPALLTYIEVAGRPVLTGVVYAVPLTAGQSPPTVFGRDAIWHEHNGTLDEEALLPDHHTAPSAAKGTRLSILHAWLWSPNPEGMFATDNWTIPFLRLGLAAPTGRAESAGRALSLLSGAEEYYLNLVGPEMAAAVKPALGACAAAAAQVVARARADARPLRLDEVEELSRAWTGAMIGVGNAVGRDVAGRMNGGRMP